MEKEQTNVANFLFEVGILSKTPRSGFHFLGSGNQTVAEHANRAIIIGFTLAMMDGKVDVGKIMQMCMLHDLHEARSSDLNYVHQKYVTVDEERAESDLAETLPFGSHMLAVLEEYKERKTRESQLAKDADTLEWILSLKEQVDVGNARAQSWLPSAVKRLKTDLGQEFAQTILETPSDNWWFADTDDGWWVHRNKE